MHLMDKAFYFTESEASPKHVAGRLILRFADNNRDIDHFVATLRSFNQACNPFNCIVKSRLGWPVKLQVVESLDMAYHVQLHQVSDVGNAEELDTFIAQIHQTLLDRAQPLWQCHVITDPASPFFAIYMRMHHAYGDGMMLLQRVMGSFATEPSQPVTPFWTLARKQHKQDRRTHKFKRFGYFLRDMLRSTLHMCSIILRSTGVVLHLTKNFFALPFSAQRTPITGQVTAGRAVAAAQLPMSRLFQLSKQLSASVNDILLTCSDIAVNRFLSDFSHINKKPLICMMPINMRAKDDHSDGNKIAIVLLPLAHNTLAPLQRLTAIKQSDSKTKKIAHDYTPLSLMHFTLLYQSIGILFEWLRLFKWTRPINHFLLSNLKGPESAHYIGAHKIESIHPISIVPPGGGINITVISYAGKMNLGMVCCKDMAEELHPMGKYVVEAFESLESEYRNINVSN